MKRLLAGFACIAVLGAQAQARVEVPSDGLLLAGLFYRPEGPGPFPAVVILHGCSGLWTRSGTPTASYRFWAEHLHGQGFAALLLDSFGARGESEICTQQDRKIQPGRERTVDAMAALRWVAGQRGVDGDRVFLLGFSNGGATVLHTAERPPDDAGRHYRAAIAFYPGCRAFVQPAGYQPSIPVLIQAGGADDWTPAAECVKLAAPGPGPRVEIDVYPDAHHAFDRRDGRLRFRPDVRNPNRPGGRGATVGPHPEAREAAVRRATEYLKQAAARVPRGTNRAGEGGLP